MTTAATYQEQTIEVAGGKVRVLKGGTGAPLLFLHHTISNHGWIPLYEQLAKTHTVYVPDIPGWGDSDRPDWARDVRDLAILMGLLLDKIGGWPITIVGAGFGGWIAAEMLTMAQTRYDQAVLIGAPGIKPREGEGDIVDQMLIDYEDYVRAGFEDEAAFFQHFGEDMPVESRLLLYGGREMTMRVTFRPWMYRGALPTLLADVQTPTLVITGANDRLVPVDIARQYADALPNGQLEILPAAAHFVDYEQPGRIVELMAAHRAKSVK